MKLTAFACLAAAGSATTPPPRGDFEAFQALHGKVYATPEETSARLEAYRANLKRIVAHNKKYDAGEESFWVGETLWADHTPEEYSAMLTLRAHGRRPSIAAATAQVGDPSAAPDSWDWRSDSNITVVGPVKNQKACGSCWAFSAVAAMEGRAALDSGTYRAFSEQEVLDCTLDGGDTCSLGGEMHDGYVEIATNHKGSIALEADYPYKGRQGKCAPDESKAYAAGISGYVNVTSGDEGALKAAVATHPVISVGIDAGGMFQLYFGGVYNRKACKNNMAGLDHGVAVVGYGTTDGKDYWWVRNSWGKFWGKSGYIMMSRGKQNQCGIATDATYATTTKSPA